MTSSVFSQEIEQYQHPECREISLPKCQIAAPVSRSTANRSHHAVSLVVRNSFSSSVLVPPPPLRLARLLESIAPGLLLLRLQLRRQLPSSLGRPLRASLFVYSLSILLRILTRDLLVTAGFVPLPGWVTHLRSRRRSPSRVVGVRRPSSSSSSRATATSASAAERARRSAYLRFCCCAGGGRDGCCRC